MALIVFARLAPALSDLWAWGQDPEGRWWGLLSWLVLGGIAAARIRGVLSGRRAAQVSIFGFVAVAATYLVLVALSSEASRFI